MTTADVRRKIHDRWTGSRHRRPTRSDSGMRTSRGHRILLNSTMIAIAFGILSTVASWPVTGLAPITGLDPSWRFGLASSAIDHIAWGPRLDFTFGPLGFLTVRSLYFGSTAILAFVYEFIVQCALFALLLRFTRRALPLPIAALVSYAIGTTTIIIALTDLGDLLMGPSFLLAILAVHEHDQMKRRFVIATLSVIGGLGVLIKFTDGLVPIAFVIVIIVAGWGAEWALDLATVAITFVFALIGGWLATGNSLGDLGSYFRYSIAIAGGYSSAMQLEFGHRTDEYWYAAILFLILGALAALSVRSKPRREQVGAALVLVGFAWWGLKEGFVGHAQNHDVIFFGMMFVAVAAFEISSPRFPLYYLSTVLFVGLIVWTAAGGIPSETLSLSADAHSFGHQIDTLVNSKLRTSAINQARVEARKVYALTSGMVSELEGHTVAIEPWENTVAWAYPAIRWDPEPVLQTYAAYTSSLDALDSHFIDSSAAPSRILQSTPTAIDSRNPFFEPPTTVVSVVCHYVQIDASSKWQVLGRVPNRCGTPQLLDRRTATFGEQVKVPIGPSGSIVVARFQSLPLSIGYKISALVLKPPILYLTSSGRPYRFITGTAGDLHLLRGTSAIGYSLLFMPFTIPHFNMNGGGVAPGSHFVVSFYSIAVGAT